MGFWFWVSQIVYWLVLGANLTLVVMNTRLRRRLHQAIKEVNEAAVEGPPLHVLARMNRAMVSNVGLDIDLVERTISDLAFLHQEAYKLPFIPGDHCPICRSTLPELKRVLGILIEIQAISSKRP